MERRGSSLNQNKKKGGLGCDAAKALLAANDVIGAVGSWILDLIGENLNSAFTIAPSVDGVYGIPFEKDGSGRGMSLDMGVSIAFDLRDPLKVAFSGHLNHSILETKGAGIFITTGPAFGISKMPEKGFSESNYVTARANAGWGYSYAAAVDLFGDTKTGNLSSGSGSFGSGGVGYGCGVLYGETATDIDGLEQPPGYSYSSGEVDFKEKLSAYYKENCE